MANRSEETILVPVLPEAVVFFTSLFFCQNFLAQFNSLPAGLLIVRFYIHAGKELIVLSQNLLCHILDAYLLPMIPAQVGCVYSLGIEPAFS